MIRLFAGIEFPENIKDQLYSLRGGVPGAVWTERENLHITLRFIGNIDEDDAGYLHDGLAQIQAPAFSFAMTQVGFFATGSQMRHLWAGVRDKHKFHAHATLAKLYGTTAEDVQKFIEYNNLFRSDEFYIDHFTLFSSHPRTDGDGSYYRVEAQYPLFGYYG
ncbi:MAG: RNA 2',3'-cyclic phosphodiesterase [Acetobacter sp.]|nr:RNA 2',3'-cyclic phosphodiesterase [Acetobacter sp.]